MQQQPNHYTHALVRPPGASYVNAIAEHPQRIDVSLAQRQHVVYVAALRQAGVKVTTLKPDERFPDACFMQDPAMVIRLPSTAQPRGDTSLGGIAILNRMGAPGRVGETALIADLLRAQFETIALTAPATLEGGDVLNVGNRLLVGQSGRTNRAGLAQLRAIFEPRGSRVESVSVGDFLHLLTAVTYIGRGIVVVHEDFAEHPILQSFEQVLVPRAEAYAANTLGIGKYVIMPAGFPATVEQIRAREFEVMEVPMSEFQKADGGISCLSLIW
jgi:dimethylargininase